MHLQGDKVNFSRHYGNELQTKSIEQCSGNEAKDGFSTISSSSTWLAWTSCKIWISFLCLHLLAAFQKGNVR